MIACLQLSSNAHVLGRCKPVGNIQTVVVKDTLYVCGGWNSVQQFDDLFILDTKIWAWSKAECGSGDMWGPPR